MSETHVAVFEILLIIFYKWSHFVPCHLLFIIIIIVVITIGCGEYICIKWLHKPKQPILAEWSGVYTEILPMCCFVHRKCFCSRALNMAKLKMGLEWKLIYDPAKMWIACTWYIFGYARLFGNQYLLFSNDFPNAQRTNVR